LLLAMGEMDREYGSSKRRKRMAGKQKSRARLVTPPLSQCRLAFRHRFINLIWVDPYVSRVHLGLALAESGTLVHLPLCSRRVACPKEESLQLRRYTRGHGTEHMAVSSGGPGKSYPGLSCIAAHESRTIPACGPINALFTTQNPNSQALAGPLDVVVLAAGLRAWSRLPAGTNVLTPVPAEMRTPDERSSTWSWGLDPYFGSQGS